MNMKQNAALEMFEYLKEHLIPLAKDKGDKVYESDTTVQIARPENKSVWDCEKEVKQLLSKIGAYSASVKNSINCVIINYSQTAQAVYIGFFVADRVTYEYIEERSFNTFIKNEKRIRGFSYSKDGILYGHSTPRAKPKEFNPSFSMYFATKETKHWPCAMKDLFSIHTYDGLFESVVYFIMLFFGETNPLWKDLAKDYTEQSAYSAIPLTVIDESHSRRELIAKYYGEDKAFKRNNKEPIGYGIFLARVSRIVKPEESQKLFGFNPGCISIGRAKNDLVKPLVQYICEATPNNNMRDSFVQCLVEDAVAMNINKRQLVPISFKTTDEVLKWHDDMTPFGSYTTAERMRIKKDSKFKNLKLPKDCTKLTTTKQMVMEGDFQHNCVATYINKVNADECSIWSQRKPDGTRNTIEIKIKQGKYYIAQMRAFANQAPLQEDLDEIQKAIEKIEIKNGTIRTKDGDTEQILYSIVPEDAFIDGISFQSENPEVATIDENGTLTAVARGSATITVTAGDVSATCKVIVQQNMKAEGPMPGRIVIPELNINTGLIYGCTQEITDAADSAAIWETGQGITVADHWNQGNYTNIQYSVPGSTIAYIDGTKYICTEYFKGHNTGTCITDNAGNDVMNTLGAGKALLYTCNGCWQNVHVAIYQMAAS